MEREKRASGRGTGAGGSRDGFVVSGSSDEGEVMYINMSVSS